MLYSCGLWVGVVGDVGWSRQVHCKLQGTKTAHYIRRFKIKVDLKRTLLGTLTDSRQRHHSPTKLELAHTLLAEYSGSLSSSRTYMFVPSASSPLSRASTTWDSHYATCKPPHSTCLCNMICMGVMMRLGSGREMDDTRCPRSPPERPSYHPRTSVARTE